MFAQIKSNRLISLIIIAFCLFAVWSLITFHNFPYLGLALTSGIFSLLVFSFKTKKAFFDWLILILSICLSVFFVLRSNPFLIFLNFISVVYLNAINVLLHSGGYKLTFIKIAMAPLFAFIGSMATKNVFPLNIRSLLPQRSKKQESRKNSFWDDGARVVKLFVSLGITFFLLIIILPLLSSANPFFKDLVENFLNVKNIFDFLFDIETIPLLLLRLFFFVPLIIVLPFVLSYVHRKEESGPQKTKTIFSKYLLIPKMVISIVLILFFITQIQLYRASDSDLAELGYTDKQQINEVFVQLSVVSFLVFLLIYGDKRYRFWPRITTYGLMLEVLFLNFVAFKSDYDYIQNWITHKRLYGFVVTGWILGALILLFWKYTFKKSINKFARVMIVYTVFVLLVVNCLNFDYLIYHENELKDLDNLQEKSLTKLSSDSYSYHEYLDILFDQIEEEGCVDYDREFYAGEYLTRIERLQEWGDEKMTWQGFNWSKWRQYQEIKDLNIQEYRDELDKYCMD